MTTYARDTRVPIAQTRNEIERTLERFGADQFAYGQETGRAMIGFRVENRVVRIVLPLVTTAESQRQLEQENRARWRTLALVIKAKLAAVETGISTFEREFLADVLLPDGSTLGAWIAPQLDQAYAEGSMPALLPALGGGS